jgi:hypothetical protein
MAYQFLLKNPNTLFCKLPLEILALIMQKLNQYKFQWNHFNSPTVILDQHYRNLIVKNYQQLNILEWKAAWVTHEFPSFIVTVDTEFMDNKSMFIKELNIRGKRSSMFFAGRGYWNMKSRVREPIARDDSEYYKLTIAEGNSKKKVWRKKIEPNTELN